MDFSIAESCSNTLFLLTILTKETGITLHEPHIVHRVLERVRLREVEPADIVSPDQLGALMKRYPDLAGDREAIGRSDSEGRCQSWRGDPGWWKRFIVDHNQSI